jgi:hypothetical protein
VNEARVPELARRGEGAPHLLNEGLPSERRKAFADSQGDMRRTPARMCVAPHVMDGRAPSAWPAGARPRPAASAAPAMILERELHRAHRL